MHPTVGEQLIGVVRRLEGVIEDPGLSLESQRSLTDSIRLLRRLESSLPRRLPFLRADNAATTMLLREIVPHLPAALADAIEVSGATWSDLDDEDEAHRVNKSLRELLTRAVRALPATVDGDAARRRIATHLRRRVAADPALNRDPKPLDEHMTASTSNPGVARS